MESFVSRQEQAKWQNRFRISTWVFRSAAAGTLALFIIFCLVIRTANARAITWTMLISMTLLGWFCIGFHMNVVRPARAEERHLDMLLNGEPEEFEGILRMAGRPVQIPKSIRILRITLEGEESLNPAEIPQKKRLNLDERLAGRMPAEGSRIRVQAVNDYITGLEVLEEGGGAPGETRANGMFRQIRRKAAGLVIPFILWTMAVVIIGGFIFSRITDTDPAHKITIYADCDIRDGAALADLLEQQLDDPVRMVKVRPFTYDLYGTEDIRKADLYIVSAAKAEEIRPWLAPLPENMRDQEDLLVLDDEPYGIPVYMTGIPGGSMRTYLDYDCGETYYLAFSAASLHLSGNEGATDDRAAETAEVLLDIP